MNDQAKPRDLLAELEASFKKAKAERLPCCGTRAPRAGLEHVCSTPPCAVCGGPEQASSHDPLSAFWNDPHPYEPIVERGSIEVHGNHILARSQDAFDALVDVTPSAKEADRISPGYFNIAAMQVYIGECPCKQK